MIDHGEHVSHVMHALCIMKVLVTNWHFIPSNVCHCMSGLRAHAAGKPARPLLGIRKSGGTLQGQLRDTLGTVQIFPTEASSFWRGSGHFPARGFPGDHACQ